MDHLCVRCPSCARLYQVDVGQIFASEPHFQCISCSEKFTFDFPPADPLNVSARVLNAKPGGSASSEALRACIRCGGMSPRSSTECLSCGVIFERAEELSQVSGLNVRPSLVRMWKIVLDDYENEEKHSEFLHACREQDALKFAQLKYEKIGRLQGGDALSAKMLGQIAALESVQVPETASLPGPAQGVVASSVWGEGEKRLSQVSPPQEILFSPLEVLILMPFLVSIALILWGFWGASGHRNVVGAGIAIGILSYGILGKKLSEVMSKLVFGNRS